jgi:hypothetical protein
VHYPLRHRTTTIQWVRHRNEPGDHVPEVCRAMSSNQKRGFRLPWGDRSSDDGADTATLERLDAPEDGDGDAVGEGPFRLAEAAPTTTTEAVPAATDPHGTSPEAEMIDSDASTTESAAAPTAAPVAMEAWPTTDRRGSSEPAPVPPPPIRVDPPLRAARRDNPLVAGLVKAMREAAVASRAETTARLQDEANTRVEGIRTRATTEAAELHKRADDDVAAIREWSKAEIARVKQETDDRIEARKSELSAEVERHAEAVERLVEQVQTTVTAFEADMDRFFEQLLAESDPARLATLAEQAPEPPDLDGEAPSAMAMATAVDMRAGQTEADQTDGDDDATVADVRDADETVDADTAPMAVPDVDDVDVPEGLHADAAAEAEAEASEGLDTHAINEWPTVVPAVAQRQESAAAPAADPNGPDSTRLLVHGLTSVAQISGFKGGLAALHGVRSVSVSSGERGVFIFTVSHDPGVDLDSGVASLSGFGASITDANDDGFTVAVGDGAR